MRRRLLTTASAIVAVTVLASCDPGWPDPSYGSISVAEVPGDVYGLVLAPDGSVLGYRPSGTSNRLFRLDASGVPDQRWSAAVSGLFRIEPALDGGAVVLGTNAGEYLDVTVRRVAPSGVLSAWTAQLPDSSVLAVRDLGSKVRLVALTEIVSSSSSVSGQLAIVDVDAASGAVLLTDLDTSTTLLDVVVRIEALIAPDGSVLLIDQVATPGATANTAPDRLRRFTASGVGDPAFGGDGAVLDSEITTPCAQALVQDVALVGSNSLGFWLQLGCGPDNELVRLTPAGVVDASFSGGGLSSEELLVGAPSGYVAGGMFPQEDGSAVGTIVTCQPQPRVSCIGFPSRVVRFDANGERDLNWGIDGLAIPLVDSIWAARAVPAGVMLAGQLASKSGVVGPRIERLVGPQAGS